MKLFVPQEHKLPIPISIWIPFYVGDSNNKRRRPALHADAAALNDVYSGPASSFPPEVKEIRSPYVIF
jgi:hypothetical protein